MRKSGLRRLAGMAILALATGSQAQAPVPESEVQAPPAQDAAQDAGKDAAKDEEASNLLGRVDALNESYLETKATVDKLSKIKVSGYVQAQWQYADSVGIQSVAGGNFPVRNATSAGSQQRFQVRRGRLKVAHESATSRYVLQMDVVPAGVSLKDAYVTLMEPWLKTFSYTMGVFDRPFGFEISYSSSSRESPERARVFQTLFPGERDMGAKLEINPSADLGFAQYLNFKGGVFTGMGPGANEIDNEQDLIGRLGFQAPFYGLNLAVDGGVSGYFGKVTSVNATAFETGKDTAGVKTWLARAGKDKARLDRNILGVDGQVYYDIPVLGGFSLRGEYLWGTHPASTSSASVYTGGSTTPALSATNLTPAAVGNRAASREVMGWYVNLVQNLGKDVQAVVKYDVFDPNTEVKGSDVGKTGSALTSADLAISTLGLGLLYYWDENTRLTAYYDKVMNEEAASTATGSLAPWKDDLTDNVFTLRVQVKF